MADGQGQIPDQPTDCDPKATLKPKEACGAALMPGRMRAMPDLIETPSDVILTPHGLLLVESAPPPSPWAEVETGRRVAAAFGESPARGLLHLGTRELNSALPPAGAWWRELARRFLTQLCHTGGLEQARELAALPPPAEAELSALAETAPPMRGGEYLNAEVLARLWRSLDELVRIEIAKHPQGAGAWLKESHPLWRMVGRVTFHLAENKRHPTHPFAFMASYRSPRCAKIKSRTPRGSGMDLICSAASTVAEVESVSVPTPTMRWKKFWSTSIERMSRGLKSW